MKVILNIELQKINHEMMIIRIVSCCSFIFVSLCDIKQWFLLKVSSTIFEVEKHTANYVLACSLKVTSFNMPKGSV